MSELDEIPVRYANAQDALIGLAQLSRMLEVARGCLVKVEQMHLDLNGMADKLVKDRKEALHAIDAITEAAPNSAGVEHMRSEYIERTAEAMSAEVEALISEVTGIIESCGGLS